jgi:4-aminobutyrate aminotransferase/(S)-3-amino-2-methylpropionate transaminase
MDTKEKYARYVNTAFMRKVQPVVFERARGSRVYDEEGKEYIDCFAGIAVTNAGHANPDIAEAAKSQIDRFFHCCSYYYYVKPVADLAEKLAAITPGRLEKTFFGNGGAEAIEGALRLAKQCTGRSEFVALQASFHGRSLATLSITGNSTRKKGGGPYMPGVAFMPPPYCYRCFFELEFPSCNLKCARFLEETVRFSTSGLVAAFIAEPVMGEGGIIVPPEGYFEAVKEICDKYDILFIADEVQSGFGRTGRMLAIEHWDVEPDIMVMAKGLADGFPLSAFTTRSEIADSFKPGDHLSTFGGNPISCAAGLANIKFLEKNHIPEAAREKGAYLMDRLNALAREHTIIGDIRGKGLMVGIELVEDRFSKTPSDLGGKIQDECLKEGILIGVGGIYGNILRIQPPLVIEKEELDAVVDCLDRVLPS